MSGDIISLKVAASVGISNGTDFTAKLPRIAEAVRSLPIDDALLDGEAVVLRPDGHSDFGALRTKRGAERASFVAFDLLRIEREDRRKLALEVRRAQLESLVAGIDTITFSEAIYGKGAIVFAKACEMGLEGIVSKRLGSVYSIGACWNWVKAKNPAFSGRDPSTRRAWCCPTFVALPCDRL